MMASLVFNELINPCPVLFQISIPKFPILNPLKTSENIWYITGTLAKKGIISLHGLMLPLELSF